MTDPAGRTFPMRRTSAALTSLLVLGGAMSACSGDDTGGAEAVAKQLAGALVAAATPQSGDASKAPDPLASVPFTGADSATVAKAYAAIVDDMDGVVPTVAGGGGGGPGARPRRCAGPGRWSTVPTRGPTRRPSR
jgi:hypothetical protein